MKKLLATVVLSLLSFQIVLACEECPTSHELTLESTIERASLIVIGTSEPSKEELPQSIEFDVETVLKGSLAEQSIVVQGYTGECEYGLIINDEKQYVAFLREDNNGQYDVVNGSCGITKLPVVDGEILYQGEEISMENFMMDYIGSQEDYKEFTPVNDKESKGILVIGLIILAILAASGIRQLKIRPNSRKK